MPPPRLSRHVEILRLRQRLERFSLPRTQMLLIVATTGGAGFLASFTLLTLGMTHMGWRYGLAFGLAYVVFLGLLWLWMRSRAEDFLDIPDLPSLGPSSPKGDSPNVMGQGGEYGGGGAQGSFAQPLEPPALDIPIGNTGEGPLPELFEAAPDVDELAIPLTILALALGLVFSSLYVVYTAPLLFAELLVDGVLAASLYRRLRGLDSPHWLETALRRTFLPFLLTGLLVTGCGWWMEVQYPGADSVGDVWRGM